MATSPNYSHTYGHTNTKLASSPPKKRAPKLDTFVGSASHTANKYLRTTFRPNAYSTTASKYNYETGIKPNYESKTGSSYTKHLYSYLSDNYDAPYSPLKMNRHNNPYKKQYMFKEPSTVDTIKGITSIRKELTDKKHLRSPKKYSLSHTMGRTSHNIVNPEYTKPEFMIDHENLEKAEFRMDDLEKERKINKDLLKMGAGYLEMCKGMLDSIKAVKIGNVAMAENAFNQNRVVMGEADAKKGKEFLERDGGVKFDEIELPEKEDFEEEGEGDEDGRSEKKGDISTLSHVNRGFDIQAISQNIIDAVFADD